MIKKLLLLIVLVGTSSTWGMFGSPRLDKVDRRAKKIIDSIYKKHELKMSDDFYISYDPYALKAEPDKHGFNAEGFIAGVDDYHDKHIIIISSFFNELIQKIKQKKRGSSAKKFAKYERAFVVFYLLKLCAKAQKTTFPTTEEGVKTFHTQDNAFALQRMKYKELGRCKKYLENSPSFRLKYSEDLLTMIDQEMEKKYK